MKLKILIIMALFTNALFSQNFHDTQGKLEISNSGQANFTLPIALPPSIKEVGPKLNLLYVSGQNSGIAGQGWEISSISNISRISTRKDIDGYRDGVDFDADDKLSLDGQRLLLKTGTYWADDSTYETEIPSNTKIELKGTGSSMYFIVTAPDGSRSWYGNYGSMNGTDATAFYIVRFEDVNGNFIIYNYTKPFSKSLCIGEIQFSGNTLTNPVALNKIVFAYKLADRKETGFVKGSKIEKVELLDKVEVFTNNLLFKKYQLTHVTDGQGYQRISQIQEFNGALEGANPISFEYKTTPDNVTESYTSYSDALDLSKSPDMSGDFDGDGKLDFISGSKLYTKLFQGAGTTYQMPYTWRHDLKRLLFTATALTNNKLNQQQSVVKVDETLNSTTFNIYNLQNGSVQNSYSKTIVMDNVGYCSDLCSPEDIDENGNPIPGSNSRCESPTYIKTSNKYLEGDFNGDSISDVLILNYDEAKIFKYDPIVNTPATGKNNQSGIADPSDGACYWHKEISETIKEARILDLNPSSPTADNTFGNYALTSANIQLLQNGERYVMDFNSDGKADILIIDRYKNYKVISFKQLTVAPWAELEVIGEGVLDSYSAIKQIFFGDFNGDGKTDILLPNSEKGCDGCNLWHIYYSNPNPAGGEFFTKESHNIVEYRPTSGSDYKTQWHFNDYYVMDINKDGKSDLVKAWALLYQVDEFGDPQNIDSAWKVNAYINNIGLNGGFTNYYDSPNQHFNGDNSKPIFMGANYKYRGLDSDLLVIRFHGGDSFDKTVTYLDFKKDFSEDNLIQKVTQSNGAIVDEIIYDAMIPAVGTNDLGNSDGFYSSTESLQYPLVEIKQMSSNKLVKLLKNTSLGVIKFQDFQYHGLSVNLNGIGILGFKKTARSSWYRDGLDKKNWNFTENSPNSRGMTVKTFTLLLNGNELFNFGTNYTNLISKAENTYIESTDPLSKSYSILLNKQTTTDYLTGLVKQTIYNSYSSDFLLPLSVTTNNLLGNVLHGSTTVVTTYGNNQLGADNNYYIGRPLEVNTTKTVYVNTPSGNPDTKTSYVKYSYTNGNLTQTDKKSNNSTETLVEKFAYFSNGQLQSKTIDAIGTTTANAVSARTTSYTYDTTNRFVKTTTDVEGLVTENLTYHNLYGTILKQKNPFGQITINECDNWGKRTKVTDFLGKSINYTYTRTGGIYKTTQLGDDGSSSMVESDALAKQIRKGSKDINGNWAYSNTEYDYLGKKIKESDPYSTSSPSLWTVFEYDDYNRPVKSTAPTGKIINTVYNGLSISANDGTMTKSKTMNANGQVVSATDTPGGTINYRFDANDNLVESDYQGIKTTIQYDNWGRKVQLTDSSSGTYTYTYNAFGETKTETTPKGTTTYTISPVGKVLTKAVMGDGTSITSTYTYDPTNKWLTNIAVDNPNDGNSNYAYSYDTTTKLLNKTVETLYPVSSATPFATFTKELTFDAYGRVYNETSTASSHGKTSSKTITNTYKNGKQWQLLDGSVIKWQANAVNARGLLTNATLGNGIGITNAYDAYGYATQNKHLLGNTNVMTLNNVFDPILANLTSRTNSMFDVKENFTYDSLDRLIAWDGAGQNLLTLPFNSTTDGFVFNGTATTGSVTNSAGTLKVVLKNTFVSVTKPLTQTVTSGNRLRVKTDITNMTGTGGVIVNAFMVETDPNNATNFVEIPLGTINNGSFDSDYTVSDFVLNPKLTLRFIIDENSPNGTNGGGATPPNATFYVDNFKIDNISLNTQNYDDRGRITENSLGQYNYTNTVKPYQNTSINPNTGASKYYTSHPLQSISYNAFKAPIQIEEQGVDKISFGYNAMLQRSIMYYGNTDADKLKRPYRKYFSADGSMEIKATFVAGNTTAPTSIEFITYVGGDAYSASVVVKGDGTNQNYYYLHRDYQGSIMAITNASGGVVEKRLYNPWGEILQIQDGAGNNLAKLTFFDRGYTGHQHLESVGLIHMNGRLYDPKLHRFLQPDNFVQDPYNTQSFNRYGYCWNNPLKYTDKNGEELVSAIVIGAAIGLASYLTVNMVNGTPISLLGMLKATVTGAVSGAVTFGIGSWTQTISSFTLRASTQALAHGVFQGTMSGIQGGGFWTGAVSGVLSSIASSAFAGGMDTRVIDGQRYNVAGTGWVGAGKFAKSTFGMITFGTVMGGAGATLTGGNFWKGAVTGLIVSSLNHAMPHGGDDGIEGTIYKDQQTLEGSWGRVLWNDVYEASLSVDYEYIVSKNGTVSVVEGSVKVGEPVLNNVYNPVDTYKPNYRYTTKIEPLAMVTPSARSIIAVRAYSTQIGLSAGILDIPMGLVHQAYEFTGSVDVGNPNNTHLKVTAVGETRYY
jgi:RHS repeat-associated protein